MLENPNPQMPVIISDGVGTVTDVLKVAPGLKEKFDGLRIYLATASEHPDRMKPLSDIAYFKDNVSLEREGFFAGTFINVDNPKEKLEQPEVIPGEGQFKAEDTSYLHMANFLQVAPEMMIFIDDDSFNRNAAEKAGLRVFDPKDMGELEAAVAERKANPVPYNAEAVAAKMEALLEEARPKPLRQFREEPPVPVSPPPKKSWWPFGSRKPKDGNEPK
jgi:hypothetical protein